jgi:hypothetical protein
MIVSYHQAITPMIPGYHSTITPVIPDYHLPITGVIPGYHFHIDTYFDPMEPDQGDFKEKYDSIVADSTISFCFIRNAAGDRPVS